MFRRTGGYLGEGFVLGVEDWLGAAGRVGDRLIDAVAPTALPAYGAATAYTGSSRSPIASVAASTVPAGRLNQSPVVNNHTYHMTVSVKDVEEMIRLSRFVDDLPQAMSLTFGNLAGGVA